MDRHERRKLRRYQRIRRKEGQHLERTWWADLHDRARRAALLLGEEVPDWVPHTRREEMSDWDLSVYRSRLEGLAERLTDKQ